MTDFELTIEHISPIFEASGFKVVDSFKNFLKLESKKVTVTIGYDERENANLFSVGQNNKDSHFLNSKNLKEVFNYNNSSNNYRDFLIDFLKNEGKGILTGDMDKLIELDAYEDKQAEIYTAIIINRQCISKAENAWTKKDYLTFIATIDQMDKDDLPNSYKLKYKIARDRIRETK